MCPLCNLKNAALWNGPVTSLALVFPQDEGETDFISVIG